MTFRSTVSDALRRASASKPAVALLFFVWSALIVAGFYGVQKPIGLGIVRGFGESIWMLLVWILLLVDAAGLGVLVLLWLAPATMKRDERILLGTGLGLGVLGLAGLGIAAVGLGVRVVAAAGPVLLAVLLWWRGAFHAVRQDARQLLTTLIDASGRAHPLVLAALGVTFICSVLLALTPPADAFDALFYHLPWPARILQNGGLAVYDVPHFWFPHLVEGAFLWALGLGSDRAAQFLHITWTLLAALLAWQWTVRVWDNRTSWWTLLVLVSMPSLPLVASWAYTDFALAFYSIATLYVTWRWAEQMERGWLPVAGIAAGMAMGVKYTSFVVPLTAGLLILWWARNSQRRALTSVLVFGITAAVVASPWYLRNWLLVDNPIYPFVLGGRFWDSFRAAWYAEAGTGIGWDLRELLLLPLNATLGHRDANFHDGRIGPLFLMTLPASLWVIWNARKVPEPRRRAVMAIALFAGVSGAFWLMGVVNSRALWQTRLLFPMLIPFAILTALGLETITRLDTPALRLSFVTHLVVAGVIVLTLVETGLFVIDRNPLAVATGVESRDRYLHRVQPAYANALDLLAETPADARVYFLFEPRSYGAPRQVQPDPILDNLAHALHVYDDSPAFVDALQQQGYTHVLLYRWGAEFMIEERADKMTPARVAALSTLTDELLVPVARTDEGGYELYVLP